MIGNSGDKILTLAVVDNGHGMGHVSSVDNIVYLRIYGSVLVIDCGAASTLGLWWQPWRMCAFQLCGKWKDGKERELVASATSTGAHRSWVNTSQ
ncbi:hypothetical protein Tco_0118288, partial [Tanacetum coccineum]